MLVDFVARESLGRGVAPPKASGALGWLSDHFHARVTAAPAGTETDLNNWVKIWNEDPKPFVWHKTADEILESLNK